MKDINFAFFGTSHIAVFVLDELKKAGLVPSLIVAPPDKAKGRGLVSQFSPVKKWALNQNVDVLQPEKISSDVLENIRILQLDLAILADYGKIILNELLEIPRRGFLNVHPSLLPRLRGPSPIRSAILNDDKDTGVSIILMDEEIDHGPIVAQKRVPLPEWPLRALALEEILMREGGNLLARIMPQWAEGGIEAHVQNHDVATYSKILKKEDGLLDLGADPYKNLLKIYAFEGWPGTYAFFERSGKKMRVRILDAHIENGELVIDTVKPEGKRQMGYEDFLRSGAKPVI